jgi:hypothetical protein
MEDVVRIFTLAVDLVPMNWAGRLSIVVPIGTARNVVLRSPDLSHVLPDDAEPPSCYLITPSYFARVANDREEFRSPYDEDPWGLTNHRTRVEYVVSRDTHSRKMGWEFSADIWFHYYALN